MLFSSMQTSPMYIYALNIYIIDGIHNQNPPPIHPSFHFCLYLFDRRIEFQHIILRNLLPVPNLLILKTPYSHTRAHLLYTPFSTFPVIN